ncbi:MAG: TolC family protein [Spirochaetia bacterium]
MKKPLRFQVLLPFLCAVLTMSTQGGYAQATAAPPQEIVTLDQCVAAARPAAPGLKLAAITLDSSRTQLIQAQAKNGLALGGTGDYVHQGSLPGTGSSATTAASAAAASAAKSGVNGENVQGGLTLSGPATSLGLTAQHSIEEGSLSDQVSSVNISGSQTVFDGYPGGRAAGTVQQADYTYRAAQVTYDATLKLTQAQLDLRSAQNTVEVDRKKLSMTVGWPIEKEYAVADSPVPDMPALQPQEALATAYQNRSELRTLELNVAAANVALALQKSQGAAVVSVNGSVGMGVDWTANVNAGVFTAGVSIALPPILDGGLQNAQVQQAADQITSYKVQQDQERQSITIDVQNALFGVRDASDRLALAGQNVKQAQGVYDLQKAKRAVGLETTLDVLTAFSTLITAQVGMQQAKSNYLLAVLNLYNVMGL